MIAVFGSFALGGQLLFQQIGIGFAVAVALDAFLLRLVLVPAVMHILGDRNWRLPGFLDRLPRIHLEEAEEVEEAEEAPSPRPAAGPDAKARADADA